MLLVSLNAFAQHRRGPGDGGGGDPLTQQFIVMGKQLAAFYGVNPFSAQLPFLANEFSKKIETIDESIRNEDIKDLVEFVPEILRDQDGVQKIALFNKKEGSVQVNIERWKQASDEERLIAITMEVSGLLSVPLRYENAYNLVKNRTALIVSVPYRTEKTNLDTSGGESRLVGYNQDQFAQITSNDVVIDAGVIGLGTENEKRLINFLSNPMSDKEWSVLVKKAWDMERPAYLTASTKDRSKAFVSSIYLTYQYSHTEENPIDVGEVSIYSFFFTKLKQVYLGPCSSGYEAKDFSAVDRILNCYINPQYYRALDFSDRALVPTAEAQEILQATLGKALHSLKESLDFIFATDEDIVEDALRENYIYNYLSLFEVFPPHYNRILTASLRAHQLKPSLTGPFENSAFWVKTSEKDERSLRFYLAMKTLAENDLGYIGQHSSCYLKDKDHRAVEGTVLDGPAVVSLKKLKELKRLGHCVGWQKDKEEIDLQLYRAMKKEGFYYDYSTKQWFRNKK